MLEKTLESLLGCREIKPVSSKGNQPWFHWKRQMLKLQYDLKSQLNGKDPDSGKDGGQEEKGTTEDEMVGWHHWLKGHEFEQTLGDSEGQGSLACLSPWGRKESDITERPNNNNNQRLNSEWWVKWLSRSQVVWSLVSYIVEILFHSEASGAHGRA